MIVWNLIRHKAWMCAIYSLSACACVCVGIVVSRRVILYISWNSHVIQGWSCCSPTAALKDATTTSSSFQQCVSRVSIWCRTYQVLIGKLPRILLEIVFDEWRVENRFVISMLEKCVMGDLCNIFWKCLVMNLCVLFSFNLKIYIYILVKLFSLVAILKWMK